MGIPRVVLCRRASFALKGRTNTAQGNALGVDSADATQALKGRDKRLFHPFRVCGGLGHRDPGRCPGLSYDAPLGVFDVLAARSGWLYTPGQSVPARRDVGLIRGARRRALQRLEIVH